MSGAEGSRTENCTQCAKRMKPTQSILIFVKTPHHTQIALNMNSNPTKYATFPVWSRSSAASDINADAMLPPRKPEADDAVSIHAPKPAHLSWSPSRDPGNNLPTCMSAFRRNILR